MTDVSLDFDAADFFRDPAFVDDPYPYFDWLRGQCPVRREPHQGVYMVTGYEEANTVYADSGTFSSCNAVTGPFPGFPVELEGRDDVSALIDAHRDELPFSDQITTMDPPKHDEHRHLVLRQLTPKRLKENEEFVWRLADRQMDEFIGRGGCEFISELLQPVHAVRHRRPPRCARGGARRIPGGSGPPSRRRGGGEHQGRDVAQPARMALPALRRLRRGPPP